MKSKDFERFFTKNSNNKNKSNNEKISEKPMAPRTVKKNFTQKRDKSVGGK